MGISGKKAGAVPRPAPACASRGWTNAPNRSRAFAAYLDLSRIGHVGSDLAPELAADQRVRSFDLMSQRLADIVKRRHAARLLFVQSQRRGHRAADERSLDLVHQHVRRVKVVVLQP